MPTAVEDTYTRATTAPERRLIDMTEEEREFDHKVWERDVRDYSAYHSEGERVIEFGSLRASYEISPLRDGRYAVRTHCDTGHSGGSSPWTAYATREDCLSSFLRQARACYTKENMTGGCATNADRKNQPLMAARLDGGMFGFEEPEPRPRAEWWDDMIADQIGTMLTYNGWDLIGVIRAGNFKPLSKSGSWWDIPLPAGWQPKGRYAGCGDVRDDELQDGEDEDEGFDDDEDDEDMEEIEDDQDDEQLSL